MSDEELRQAAAAMGRARTPAKAEAARANGKLGGRRPGSKLTAEHRAAIADGKRRAAAARNVAPPGAPVVDPGRAGADDGRGHRQGG